MCALPPALALPFFEDHRIKTSCSQPHCTWVLKDLKQGSTVCDLVQTEHDTMTSSQAQVPACRADTTRATSAGFRWSCSHYPGREVCREPAPGEPKLTSWQWTVDRKTLQAHGGQPPAQAPCFPTEPFNMPSKALTSKNIEPQRSA